jgi:hypothetical protein
VVINGVLKVDWKLKSPVFILFRAGSITPTKEDEMIVMMVMMTMKETPPTCGGWMDWMIDLAYLSHHRE